MADILGMVDIPKPLGGRAIAMNRIAASLAVLGFSFAAGLSSAAERSLEEAKAIAEIEKLGGRVTMDEKSSDKLGIEVEFANGKATDKGLERLEALTNLQTLDASHSKVTDAGLKHLHGMSTLRCLDLAYTKVTDAGLKQLRALTNLQSLGLQGTQVTDAGLVTIKHLVNLQSLQHCLIPK